MGWAEEQAARIAQQESRIREEKYWSLHEAALIRNGARQFFSKICECIEQYTAEFKKARKGADIRCERSADRIKVRKEPYPMVWRELVLVENPIEVASYERRMEEPYFGFSEDGRETLRFSVDESGNLFLRNSDYETIARQILGPVFEAFTPTR